MASSKKVLLIGWDAADWKIINPLLDKGLMPNLEKIVNNGTIGNLATMDPSYSPMLWTSIATGKHAYKHGILGFLQSSDDGKTLRPVLSTSRKVRAIWEILSEKDFKTHVVGWWPSHPAEPMNGISISNFYQKSSENPANKNEAMKGSIYPANLHSRFEQLKINAYELTGQHIVPFIPLADKIDQTKNDNIYKVANETAQAATVQAAFTNIIRNEEWDFAAVYFDAIDHYCHGYMKYHPPKMDHIPQNKFDLYKDIVTAGYRFHDMMLGRLLELINEETTVLLISDHGFQPDHLRPKVVPKEPGGLAYEHSPFGIFAAMGPNIKKDYITYGATLLDICPTILNLFDLPVGADMDGNVLVDVFKKPKPLRSIESWEKIDFTKFIRDQITPLNLQDEEALFHQLVALGYVEPMKENKKEAVRDNNYFNQFNLAKSFLFGGQLDDAMKVLEKLVKENPNIPRYKFHLAVCYQAKGQLRKCREVINDLKQNDYYNPTALSLMEATLLIGEKKYQKSLKILEQLESNGQVNEAEVYAKMAKCYMSVGQRQKAQSALIKGKDLDYDHAKLHHYQGILHFHNNEDEMAIESLLTALGLDYNNAATHRYLGTALYRSGEYEKAATALEICLKLNPKNNSCREDLLDLYKIHLQRDAKAAEHRKAFYQQIAGEVIVVAGLPRSGTSLMMQMLEKGGLEIYADNQRKADDNNPKGYYEHESVKTIMNNKRWVKNCVGKAVKIITNLLPALPLIYNYKIIMMERDLDEILSSQRKMLQRLGKKVDEDLYPYNVLETWQYSKDKVMDWVIKQKNIELLIINHVDVINDPFTEALKVSAFLGNRILPEEMIKVVDPTLYREKQILKT